jgi:hypothetical protein
MDNCRTDSPGYWQVSYLHNERKRIGIQLKGRAISDSAKITTSEGVVVQKEDARAPKKPIKRHPNTSFLKNNLLRP